MEQQIYVSHGEVTHSIRGCYRCDDCIRVKKEFIKAVLDGTFNALTGIELTEEQIKKITQ